ncbi:MAG: hypothetical protein ACOZB3_09975 [Calditrichota bacterium]
MLRKFHKVLILSICLGTTAFSQPATFVFDVAVPAGGTPLTRPGGVYVDQRTQELYVVDSGNSRIVIFDKNGRYDFSFSDRRHMLAPEQIAVDSVGRIFVLNSIDHSKLHIFDYNGKYLSDLTLSYPDRSETISVASFLLDDQDRLFAATIQPAHMYVFTATGSFLYDFPLYADGDNQTRDQSSLGRMSIVNGDLMIPMPMVSQVARYTLSGELTMMFGIAGGGFRELAFPVAVAGDGEGKILVLDRMRHTILRFNNDGTFADERGGLGDDKGWFYLPSAMAGQTDGLCYVAQMYNSRVQAIRVTDEIPETNIGLAGGEAKE